MATIYGVPSRLIANVGIDTTNPISALHVSTSLTSFPRGILSAQYDTGTSGALFISRKARGTESSPSTVVTGDVLAEWSAEGYDSANYLKMAQIRFESTGTIAATRVPTKIIFATATDAAPSVLTDRWYILPAGDLQGNGASTISTTSSTLSIKPATNLGVGTGTPSYKLHVFQASDNTIASFDSTLANTTGGGQMVQILGANNNTDTSYGLNRAPGLIIRNSDGGANTYAMVGFADGGGNVSSGFVGLFENDANNQGSLLLFSRASGGSLTEKMRVASTGAVGIGTTVPGSFGLAVNHSTGSCLDLIYNDSDGSPANHCKLTVTSGGILTIEPLTSTSTPTSVSIVGGLTFSADNTYSIGANGSTRPLNVFAGGTIVAPVLAINNGGSSTRVQLTSPSDGILKLYDAAGTSFDRIQFAVSTSAGPAIKRNGTALNFRLADDSADCGITASTATFSATTAATSSTTGSLIIGDGVAGTTVGIGGGIIRSGGIIVSSSSITAGASSSFGWNGRSLFSSPSDGTVTLYNNAASDFTMLQFGGVSSAFPAIIRSGAALQARLADNSARASFECSTLGANGQITTTSSTASTSTSTGALVVTGGVGVGGAIYAGGVIVGSSSVTAGSGNAFSWNGRSSVTSPSDGNIRVANNATSDFGLLQFGGTTSSFPALKRSSTTLAVRLADDSADAPITASTATFSATTASTSTTTGALVVTGGVGVGGAINGGSTISPSASSVTWRAGSGTPEGVVTAVVGSIYSRTDGGAATSFYVKESGSGNTGWVAK